jgi:hypothetical protein
MQWNDRFAKWKREGMGLFRQQNAMFNELLNIVRGDINNLHPRKQAYRVVVIPG